ARRTDRGEIGSGKAVVNDARGAPRDTDLLAVGALAVLAFEDDAVGQPLQAALDPEIDHALEASGIVVQAAAVRRVVGAGAEPPRGKTGKHAALGAVAVDDVGPQVAAPVPYRQRRRQIERRDGARHLQPPDAEGADMLEFRQRFGRLLAAGQAVADDADLGAASGKAPGQVADVTEQPADRGSEAEDDAG